MSEINASKVIISSETPGLAAVNPTATKTYTDGVVATYYIGDAFLGFTGGAALTAGEFRTVTYTVPLPDYVPPGSVLRLALAPRAGLDTSNVIFVGNMLSAEQPASAVQNVAPFWSVVTYVYATQTASGIQVTCTRYNTGGNGFLGNTNFMGAPDVVYIYGSAYYPAF